MSKKHTPGPWYTDGMGNDPQSIAITAGESIDGPDYQRESKIAEVHTAADARLIAAAPDLLTACKALLECIDTYGGHGNPGCPDRAAAYLALEQAEKAIAKAGDRS